MLHFGSASCAYFLDRDMRLAQPGASEQQAPETFFPAQSLRRAPPMGEALSVAREKTLRGDYRVGFLHGFIAGAVLGAAAVFLLIVLLLGE